MKLNRRQFLQGLAAGLVVAAAPPVIRRAVAVEAKEELKWGFIVRGRQADLIMIPPGHHVPYGIGERYCGRHIYEWPRPFDLDELLEEEDIGVIELLPWAPYRPAMQSLIPPELEWKSRNWRPRRFR